MSKHIKLNNVGFETEFNVFEIKKNRGTEKVPDEIEITIHDKHQRTSFDFVLNKEEMDVLIQNMRSIYEGL
jgi:hypothetical protein